MENTIEVENLVKIFGDITAVKNVSFKIKKGEIFAFLGPNGAGKTTTINMLTTLVKPTEGNARVAGYDIRADPQKVREKIGIVFQDSSLDRDLTAYDNMLIHGRIYGYGGTALREKIGELLRFVELEKFKKKIVKTFSGGMARRLEIAKALLHEPEVLFLDEPTLGLDPQTRTRIWEYITQMKEEHEMTIFLTTHYMDEAEQFAERIAIIDHGEIIAKGTPDKLKKKVGSDVVYLTVANGKKKCVDAAFVKNCTFLPDERIELGVENAGEAIPRLFELAEQKHFKIVNVSYHKPTLNDVFLHLTGREIREERGDSFEMVRAVMRRRGR